jgi:hypothetical protein
MLAKREKAKSDVIHGDETTRVVEATG